jgi:hypothetical protein
LDGVWGRAGRFGFVPKFRFFGARAGGSVAEPAVDEAVLVGRVGTELGAAGIQKGRELPLAFAGQNDVARGETVAAGVAADGGFAWRGPGAGAEAAIPVVGLDLLLAGHGTASAARIRGQAADGAGWDRQRIEGGGER